MDFNSRDELLKYLLDRLPDAAQGVTYDLDDRAGREGVAYVTTASRDFKITVEETEE